MMVIIIMIMIMIGTQISCSCFQFKFATVPSLSCHWYQHSVVKSPSQTEIGTGVTLTACAGQVTHPHSHSAVSGWVQRVFQCENYALVRVNMSLPDILRMTVSGATNTQIFSTYFEVLQLHPPSVARLWQSTRSASSRVLLAVAGSRTSNRELALPMSFTFPVTQFRSQ